MRQADLMRSGCPQEPNPSRVCIVPQPPGAATSSHHHQCHLQSPRGTSSTKAGRKALRLFPGHPNPKALPCSGIHCFQWPQKAAGHPRKAGGSSSLALICDEATPKSLTAKCHGIQLFFAGWLRDHMTPGSVLNYVPLDSEIRHLWEIISLNRHRHLWKPTEEKKTLIKVCKIRKLEKKINSSKLSRDKKC